MSTETIYKAVLGIAERHVKQQGSFRTLLDIGAGSGKLIAHFKERWGVEARACDYTDTLMALPGQRVEVADLNKEKLPYPDNQFDVVTATEVVEHLERYREVLRDIYRVTKPGGLCILTTPNILNLNSRLRFLWFGFWNLFGPLPVGNQALQTTGGHINPVSYFYLAHSLLDAGFTDVSVTVDKHQRSAIPKLVFLYLPLRLFAAMAWSKEVNRYKTISPENAPLVAAMNTVPVLLGRTIVVACRKPK